MERKRYYKIVNKQLHEVEHPPYLYLKYSVIEYSFKQF